MSSKINWLINHTSPGSLVLQQWLTKNGIRYSLTQKYAKSGWLKKLSSGVYYRPEPGGKIKPDWPVAIQALTQQLQLPVHLAGLSSLTHQGLSHYLPLNSEQVWIGTKSKQILPKWFREFSELPWLYSINQKLCELTDKDFTTVTVKGKELRASRPEFAAYEVVDAIGKNIRFEHAAELFQGLVNLSPRKVQSLLNRSSAVQTNRIFLFLSHYCGHQWFDRLDESQIQLGSGKRQVVTNGRYDERYQITVPQSLSHPAS
ncbi:type IV toxin-antitoxin system AbiEi family antitoxin [Endozoicomonas sp. ONNA1]|uniref:type IV toxin-antitoxin system AbiEi family antitoxin n=1 Tax=Endozoicomonas sp. ONNA1 TaxID=2828740 RepID=UPI0021483F3C|nr:type IV toxin-antitoxin system AbiEi family antitoxin [Endozoicomonas sp. ONNA1]